MDLNSESEMGFGSDRKKLKGKNVDEVLAEEQMLLVQIPRSEIFDDSTVDEINDDAGPIQDHSNKPSWFKRKLSQTTTAMSSKTIGIRMTKAEFLAYFARDEKTGEYKKGVVEPPEGRKAWLQKRLPENDPEQWDYTLKASRQLAATKGTGYLGMVSLVP